MSTTDTFDARDPDWGDWKATFHSQPEQLIWHATLDLDDGRRWYARWDPAVDRGLLVRLPWNDASPVRDLGWWANQQAFSHALHTWITEGIPLGADATLSQPKLIDGPVTTVRYLPEGREPMATPSSTPEAEPPPAGPTDFTNVATHPPVERPAPPADIGQATTLADFLAERPSRGVGDHDLGFFWQDPSGRLDGTWRLTWSEGAKEAWIIQLPDTPGSTVIPLGQWHTRPEFLAAIPDWPKHANLQGLDWLLRSTGNADILDARPDGAPIHDTDPVPTWAPPGSVGHLDAVLMRKVLAGAMATSGDTIEKLSDALGLDAKWAASVLQGDIERVPATVAVGLATMIGGYPEDLYGPNAGASVGWVLGHQSTVERAFGPSGPDLGP